MTKPPSDKIVVATNRKAWHEYEILQECEAGLQLKGGEVKSLRGGGASLDGCFAKERGGELYLVNLYVAPYRFTTIEAPEPRRDRKLLLHKTELRKLLSSLQTKRLTLVPLELYFRQGWAKVRLALARGKKLADERESIRKKSEARELGRSFKGKFRV